MKLQEFSEYEILVLRRAIRGRGLSAVGGVTIDAQFLCGGVRADLRGAVNGALAELVRRGLIRRIPKPGNPVFTVSPDVAPLLELIDAESTQQVVRPTAGEIGVEPSLLNGILGTLKAERYVILLSYEASQQEDVPDVDSGTSYKQIDLVLEVTCPKTGEKWIRKITLGVMNQHPLETLPCVYCDKYHSFRGVRLVPPKH